MTKGTEDEQAANRYGYALSLAKDGNLAKARKELADLALLQPENLWILLAQAEMSLNDNPHMTISMLEPLATQEHPHPAVIEIYTKAMLESGQVEQANRYLRKHLLTNVEHIQLLKLHAKTAAESGSVGEAYLADADYHFKIGDLKIALSQLKYAEQNSSDFYTVSIAREKIRVVSNELRWRAN
ncbi:MAG: hypothetical protein F4Z97_03060 [Gammaproteobacteria bacterium]|nr:hypothetical protein [Gammaproteobacteria bacterium]